VILHVYQINLYIGYSSNKSQGTFDSFFKITKYTNIVNWVNEVLVVCFPVCIQETWSIEAPLKLFYFSCTYKDTVSEISDAQYIL